MVDGWGNIMLMELENAIAKRKEGDYESSIHILTSLVEQFPNDAYIYYQCASSMDVAGREADAVPYYKRAISLGLDREFLQHAFIGLGSTYRTLGKYKKAKETLQEGMELFPNNNALKAFYAMTLYNLKKHDEAMEILLRVMVETSNDQAVQNYQRAIKYYADKLDKTWE